MISRIFSSRPDRFDSFLKNILKISYQLVYWSVFPACFVEGAGLTRFKKVSEYVISIILFGAIILLFQKRRVLDQGVFRLLSISIALTIGSELAFTFYVSVYGFSNLIGHYFKIASFYLIYRALIETGLVKPYDFLFRNLKQSEENLLKSEKKFRLLYERAPLSYQSLDENGLLIDVNQAWLDRLGYTKDEVRGKSFSDFLHPGSTDHFKENFSRFKAVGEFFGVEFEVIKRMAQPCSHHLTGR